MPVGLNGQALGTVGMEFEGTGLERGNLAGTFASVINNKFQKWGQVLTVGRDASVESVAEYLRIGQNRIPLVSIHTKLASKLLRGEHPRKNLGYEIITSPLEIPQLEAVVYDTVIGLQNLGDFFSNRASTHYHIGFPHNLRMMKNLLRISLMLDPVLYRLGGMGGIHRGGSNLYAYCRPLMNSAAVPVLRRGNSAEEFENAAARAERQLRNLRASLGGRVSTGNNPPPRRILAEEGEEEMQMETPVDSSKVKYVQVINPMAALEADNLESFWASFGIPLANPTAHKYHPMRYSGVNFYAIAAHGTIEFRHANFCRKAPLIMALAKFLRAATETAALAGKTEILQFEPIPSNSEISVSDGVQVLSLIMKLAREKEVEFLPDDFEMALLVETLANSSFAELPEKTVLSHIRDFMIDSRLVEKGRLIPVENPLTPKQVDIHNISMQSLFD